MNKTRSFICSIRLQPALSWRVPPYTQPPLTDAKQLKNKPNKCHNGSFFKIHHPRTFG